MVHQLPLPLYVEIGRLLFVQDLFAWARTCRAAYAALDPHLDKYRKLPREHRCTIVTQAAEQNQVCYLLYHVLRVDVLSMFVVAECLGRCGTVPHWMYFRRWSRKFLNCDAALPLVVMAASRHCNLAILEQLCAENAKKLMYVALREAIVQDVELSFMTVEARLDKHQIVKEVVQVLYQRTLPEWLKAYLLDLPACQKSKNLALSAALGTLIDEYHVFDYAIYNGYNLRAALDEYPVLMTDRNMFKVLDVAVATGNLSIIDRLHDMCIDTAMFYRMVIVYAIRHSKDALLEQYHDHHAQHAYEAFAEALSCRRQDLADYFYNLLVDFEGADYAPGRLFNSFPGSEVKRLFALLLPPGDGGIDSLYSLAYSEEWIERLSHHVPPNLRRMMSALYNWPVDDERLVSRLLDRFGRDPAIGGISLLRFLRGNMHMLVELLKEKFLARSKKDLQRVIAPGNEAFSKMDNSVYLQAGAALLRAYQCVNASERKI